MNVNRTTRAMIVIFQVIHYVKRKTMARKLGMMAQPGGWQNGSSGNDKASPEVRFAVVNSLTHSLT